MASPRTADPTRDAPAPGDDVHRAEQAAAALVRATEAHCEARTGPAEERRLRILEAAAFLFAERGFTRTKVSDIAERAGVSKGLVYVHFPSKEALFEKVLSIAMLQWMVATAQAAGDASSPVPQRIASMLRGSITFAQRSPLLRTLLAQDPNGLLPPEMDHTDRLRESYVDSMAELLRLGVERGELREGFDAGQMARAIWLSHSGLIRDVFIGPGARTGDRPEALTEAMIELVLSGVGLEPKEIPGGAGGGP